jgi:hypothetical protein
MRLVHDTKRLGGDGGGVQIGEEERGIGAKVGVLELVEDGRRQDVGSLEACKHKGTSGIHRGQNGHHDGV